MAITNNKFVDSWIDEMTAMVQPDKIVLITGEEDQLEALRKDCLLYTSDVYKRQILLLADRENGDLRR